MGDLHLGVVGIPVGRGYARLTMPSPAKTLTGLVAAMTLAVVAPAAHAASGSLDRSFGGDGRVMTKLGTRYGSAEAIAVQGDGKLVVAGYKSTAGHASTPGSAQFVLARHRRNGKLDRRFGPHHRGWLSTGLGSVEGWANDVAIQPDGKIVVAGATGPDPAVGENFIADFAVARFRPNGRLDPTFGDHGRVVTDFEHGSDQGESVLLQPDGKIIVVGERFEDVSESSRAVAIARYDSDGSLDSSFGTGGRALEHIETDSAQMIVSAGALDPTGQILIAGKLSYGGPTPVADPAIARFNDDGTVDSEFGTDGVATVDFGSPYAAFTTVAVDSADRIVAAGLFLSAGTADGPRDFAIARFTAGGVPDAQFGDQGHATTDFGGREDTALGLATAGARPVVAGMAAGKFALARYRADGTLDSSFSRDGRVITRFRGGEATARAVALQEDRRIVLAGSARRPFALARYRP